MKKQGIAWLIAVAFLLAGAGMVACGPPKSPKPKHTLECRDARCR